MAEKSVCSDPDELGMLSIGFVAANLGVSTSTLRKWEERYGHPQPHRSEGGSRWYREADLIALRQAKRLLDRGIRAHRVFADFDTLLAAVEDASEFGQRRLAKPQTGPIAEFIGLIDRNDLQTLKDRLRQLLNELGTVPFIDTVAAPLLRAVGEQWGTGGMDVYQEHATTEILSNLLVQRAPQSPVSTQPVMVLTTPPGEQHGIGLDMVTTAMTEAGAHCVNLGPSLPLASLLDAAKAFEAEIVGLSITSISAGRLTRRFIEELRSNLQPGVGVWIGGSGAALMPTLPDGVRAFLDIREPTELVRELSQRERGDAGSASGSV